jgi:hypothetical protein
MTDLELAWLAGLLEDEGSFVVQEVDGRPKLSIQCGMTDPDVVERVARVAAVGRVYGPYARIEREKPITCWVVRARADVVALASKLHPHMGTRRRAELDRLLAVDAATPLRTWSHGKETSYKRHGCRCKACCAAARRAARERYRRRVARGLPGRGSVEYNERRKARARVRYDGSRS